jgi:hypothetical protein
MTKKEKIQLYVKNNRDDIAKKLRKIRYEKVEEEHNFEEKIRSIIPCNECLVRASCADKFRTNWLSYSIECEILRTFNESIGYVLNHGGYKKSSDYKQRAVKYVKKKVAEGKIKL